MQQLERTVEKMEDKIDRLVLAIVGGALTFAVGIAVFAVTWSAGG